MLHLFYLEKCLLKNWILLKSNKCLKKSTIRIFEIGYVDLSL